MRIYLSIVFCSALDAGYQDLPDQDKIEVVSGVAPFKQDVSLILQFD